MKFIVHGDTLKVSDIRELATATANSFQTELNAALPAGVRHIDLDLSQTQFVDCGGLGALVAFWKKASNANGNATVRLLNPPKPLQRMVTMMKMDDVFPIATAEPDLKLSVSEESVCVPARAQALPLPPQLAA